MKHKKKTQRPTKKKNICVFFFCVDTFCRNRKKCTFDEENIKKGTKKCQKVHLGNPDPKILESCKKCTSDEENIKKCAKKCQKVHLGNPDPKITERGKMHF
jgi:hypothetical protein